MQPTRDAGVQVELGGDLPDTAAAPMTGRGELIGVIAALLVLVLAFGSVVGAGLPIGTALVGLGVGVGRADRPGRARPTSAPPHPPWPPWSRLGVGIDYALLLVTRHVEYLRQGHDVAESAGRAMATAGRSVVFAATTVLVSLLGLRLAGLSTYSTLRLRHRHRGGRRAGGLADAGPGLLPVRRPTAAPAPGTPLPRAGDDAADGPLGPPRRSSAAPVGRRRGLC